jgi:hypothetical protein
LHDILSEGATPEAGTVARLRDAAADLMGDGLRRLGSAPADIPHDFAALAVYYAAWVQHVTAQITIQLRAAGSCRAVARRLTVSPMTVSRWRRHGGPTDTPAATLMRVSATLSMDNPRQRRRGTTKFRHAEIQTSAVHG